MKAVLLAIMLAIGTDAAASEKIKRSVLGNNGNFIVLSDVETDKFSVFLSYTGKQMNHCGITVRTGELVGEVKSLNKAIVISSDGEARDDLGKILDDKIVAKVNNPEQTTFGESFTIATRSGESLSKVIDSLDSLYKTEVIVEILGCE